LPYTLRISEFMGTVEERTPHCWRKGRYSYMDARRHANAQGLTMKGPRRIYDAFYSSAGMLFAQRHGLFRAYHDTVFRRFWSHDLEIDELSDISGVIASVGGSGEAFEAYVRGPARAEHDRIIEALTCDAPIVLRGCKNDISGVVRSPQVFALDLVTLEIGIALLWSTRYRRAEGHLREPVWKPLQLSHLG
jgi:hypothetical protein